MSDEIYGKTDMEINTRSCGVIYALSKAFIDHRRKDHKTFYCPNGCGRHFPGKTDEEKMRELHDELINTKERLASKVACCESKQGIIKNLEARCAGMKGAYNKLKKQKG